MIPTVGVDVLVSLADKLTAPLKNAEDTVAKASERMSRRRDRLWRATPGHGLDRQHPRGRARQG